VPGGSRNIAPNLFMSVLIFAGKSSPRSLFVLFTG
jgi:hypothetical protein